jgi:2'-5' RNA ligase
MVSRSGRAGAGRPATFTELSMNWARPLPPDDYAAAMTSLMTWLVPAAGPERTTLAEVIGRLAEKHGGPVFAPHITITPTIDSDPDEATSALEQITARIAPFDVSLDAVGHEPAYYRALYLRAVPCPQLTELNQAARQAWELDPAVPYVPHLSLLYSDIPDERKDPIIAEIGLRLPAAVHIDAAELWAVGEAGVLGWRRVARVPLRPA